jgi:hypothetical protein
VSTHDGASMPRGADPIRYCDGCGGIHGAVGVELACLRTKLAETRAALANMLAAAVLRRVP